MPDRRPPTTYTPPSPSYPTPQPSAAVSPSRRLHRGTRPLSTAPCRVRSSGNLIDSTVPFLVLSFLLRAVLPHQAGRSFFHTWQAGVGRKEGIGGRRTAVDKADDLLVAHARSFHRAESAFLVLAPGVDVCHVEGVAGTRGRAVSVWVRGVGVSGGWGTVWDAVDWAHGDLHVD